MGAGVGAAVAHLAPYPQLPERQSLSIRQFSYTRQPGHPPPQSTSVSAPFRVLSKQLVLRTLGAFVGACVGYMVGPAVGAVVAEVMASQQGTAVRPGSKGARRDY